MCGIVHTLAALYEKPKLYGLAIAGEVSSTGGERSGQIWDTRGNTYSEECKVGNVIHRDMDVLGFWDTHRMCVFDVHVVDMGAPSYEAIHPTRILSQDDSPKIGKYIYASIEI